MMDDPDAIFWSKAKVRAVTGLSEAEQERKRRAGTFPQLIVLSDNANDPQARVAYIKAEVLEWCRNRPRRPTRLPPHDDSDGERPTPPS